MALISPSLDYTSRDFDSIVARLDNLIDSVFPDWTDRNKADFGNILKDMFAFSGDILAKYQDAQARETRWSQATQRKSLLALVKMIAYVPSGITAAQATESFTLTSAAAADVIIPAGTTVSSLDVASPVTYQLLADLTIPAATLSASAVVENSTSRADSFSSSGLPNQTFTASQLPYIDRSAVVTAGDGAYAQVANFLASAPADRHYTIAVDSQQRPTISFGNGVNGAIPQGTIAVAYKTGGGSSGRADANTLQKLNGNFTDIHGAAVQITVNNLGPSSGGLDAQTNAQIQTLAPTSIRPAGRAISLSDFTDVAQQVPGVARSLFTTSNEDPAVPENVGILYIVPPGAGAPSQSLLDAVLAAFAGTPFATCFRVLVQQTNYLIVDVVAKIYRAKGVLGPTAKASVLATLQSLFIDTIGQFSVFRANGARFAPSVGNPNPDAGKPNTLVGFGLDLKDAEGAPTGLFPFSVVFDAIGGTPGIRKVGAGGLDVTLNGERADLTILVNQFVKLGSVTVVDGDTGVAL